MPPVSTTGVPVRVAVPSPLSSKVTPLGRVPTSANAGTGKPVDLIVNVPAAKIALLALAITGGWNRLLTNNMAKRVNVLCRIRKQFHVRLLPLSRPTCQEAEANLGLHVLTVPH